MLLPYLGGSPAVWNTCMVFFQVMLLAGYLYAHLLPRKIGNRKHAIFHLVLLLTAALLLPIGIPEKAIALLPSASNAHHLVANDPANNRRAAFFHSFDQRSFAPELVLPYVASTRSRSLFSIRGKQFWQPVGVIELSAAA